MASSGTDLKRDRSAWQFSVRSLVLATALVAWILAVNRWLGAPGCCWRFPLRPDGRWSPSHFGPIHFRRTFLS